MSDDITDFGKLKNKESVIDSTNIYIGDEDITFEEASADVTKRFYYLLQTFFRAAKLKTKGNDIVIQMYFHAVVGAYLKEYTILKGGGMSDLRIPIIWVQDSSSGKSQLNKVSIDIARRLGMKAVEVTDFSASGLIGTFDKDKHSANIKNGLSRGSPSITKTDKQGNQRTIAYQIPLIYGDVYYYDLLFFDEAKILFQESRHTENVLSILQPALDFPGRVRKKLSAEEPVEYDCNCTIIATTTDWGDSSKDIMSQGYFPRNLFYSRSLGINDYVDNIHSLTESFLNEVEYQEHLDKINIMIEKHATLPIGRDRKKIYVREECLPIISAAAEKWFRVIGEKLYGADAAVAKPFASRLHIFIYKIAGQVAVLNGLLNPGIKNEMTFLVGPEEIDYAINMLDRLFLLMIDTLSVGDSALDRSVYSLAMEIINIIFDKKLQELPRREIIDIIQVKREMGKQKAHKMYQNFIMANLFSDRKDPATGVVYGVPNWKLFTNNVVVNKTSGGKDNGGPNMQKT